MTHAHDMLQICMLWGPSCVNCPHLYPAILIVAKSRWPQVSHLFADLFPEPMDLPAALSAPAAARRDSRPADSDAVCRAAPVERRRPAVGPPADDLQAGQQGVIVTDSPACRSAASVQTMHRQSVVILFTPGWSSY